jgi:hypothetical protein
MTSEDRVERGPQLVAHRGEETRLGEVGFLGAPPCLVRHRLGGFQLGDQRVLFRAEGQKHQCEAVQVTRDIGEKEQRGDEQPHHQHVHRHGAVGGRVGVDRNRQHECREHCLAQAGRDDGRRGDGQQQDHRLDDGELLDPAGAAVEGGEIGPAEPRHEMTEKEVASRGGRIYPRGLNAFHAARQHGKRRIEGDREERPDEDLAAHPADQRRRGDDHDHQRDGGRAVDDGARVEPEQLTMVVWIARLLCQALARGPDRPRHIAVAVGLAAIHNDLVGHTRGLQNLVLTGSPEVGRKSKRQ